MSDDWTPVPEMRTHHVTQRLQQKFVRVVDGATDVMWRDIPYVLRESMEGVKQVRLEDAGIAPSDRRFAERAMEAFRKMQGQH